ncbi:MAG: AAA family ATPase [Desulfobacterales bacterium]
MIRRIELVNFMSHPHTVIEPAEGLTVLTGGNNTGKSAVISALQTLCRNISGDYMVRHGQKECRIIVETGEGNVLEWKRKKGTVSYTVNGREVHRLRGAVPDDLHDLLCMPQVETEGEPFDVHFGEQKKPIFLLDESPGRRATFFASSSDAIKLIEMQSRHRTRVREARNEEGRLASRSARLQQRIQTLAPLDELEEQIKGLETAHEAIGQLARQLSDLDRHVDAMVCTESMAKKHADLAGAAASLAPPPELAEIGALAWMIRQMDYQSRRIQKESEAAKAVSRVQAPPDMADVERLSGLISQMQRVSAGVGKAAARGRVLSDCPVPPEMIDIAGLGRHIEAMEKAEKSLQKRSGELKQAETRLVEAEKALRRFIDAHNICPTCGQPMDADQVLHQFHGTGEQGGQ